VKEMKGRKILLVSGWLAVIAAFFTGTIFSAIVAVCIGVVLKIDYDEQRKGVYLIIMGILSGLSCPVLGTLVIWYMDHKF
jgi:hypothetical protein